MLESSNLTRLRNSIKRIDKYVSLQKLQKLLEEQGETLKGLANASKQQVADLSVQLAAKDAQLHEAAQQVAASKEELAELTDSRKEELAELMEQVAAKDRQLRELALKTAHDRDVFHNEEILKLQMQLRSEVAKRDELRDDLLKVRQQALTSENLGSELQREKELMTQELIECKEEMNQCRNDLMQARQQALDAEKLGADAVVTVEEVYPSPPRSLVELGTEEGKTKMEEEEAESESGLESGLAEYLVAAAREIEVLTAEKEAYSGKMATMQKLLDEQDEALQGLAEASKHELAELTQQVAAKDRQLRELALKTAHDRDVFHNEEILKLQMQLRSEVAKRDELEAKQNNHFREKESAVRDKNEAEKALDEVGLKRMYGVAYRCGKRGRHIGVREEGAG